MLFWFTLQTLEIESSVEVTGEDDMQLGILEDEEAAEAAKERDEEKWGKWRWCCQALLADDMIWVSGWKK